MVNMEADIRPAAHPVPQSSPKPGRWSWAIRSLAAGAKNLVRVKPILAGVLKLIQEGALQSGHQAKNCDRFCAKIGKVLQEIKMKLQLLLLSIASHTISAQRLVEAGTLVRRDLHSLS